MAGDEEAGPGLEDAPRPAPPCPTPRRGDGAAAIARIISPRGEPEGREGPAARNTHLIRVCSGYLTRKSENNPLR